MLQKSKNLAALAGALVLLLGYATTSNAALINCSDTTTKNHMQIDDAQVSSCLASGVGNINGNPLQDAFLKSVGGAYTLASKSDDSNTFNIAYNTNTNTWSFDASFWSDYSGGAIGFKFGTGNQPDEWFVYQLTPSISNGDWKFVNVLKKGGGLSHANLYGIKGTAVPEPGIIALMLFGLALVALTHRRRQLPTG